MSAPTVSRSINLRLVGAAHYIARADWDALASRGYHRHAWHLAAESCGAEARHVRVFEGSELVAVIPAYIERETPPGELHARWYGHGAVLGASVGAALRSSLVIGAPMGVGSLPLGSDLVLTEAVIEEALELLESEARAEGLKAIVWPFVSEDATIIRDVARRSGFRESFADAEAVIDVSWSSAEAYLDSHPKHVMRTLRNELAWVHDQAINVSWESNFAAHASVFDGLYRASYLESNRREATFASELLSALAAQESPGVHAQSAWEGSTLLGMAIALEAGGVLDMCMSAHAGEPRSALLHHHCLCYDPLRVGIARGLKRVYLGPGNLDSKVVRGARLISRFTLARGLTPAARAAIGVLAPVMNGRNRSKHRRLTSTLSDSSAAW